jgi:thiol-disulfide isomerase/thioredoxin
MLALYAAAAMLVSAAPSDVVMLDFTATWCGPCQRMAPAIGQLESSGYPIRKVDYDTERALVQQYRVTGVPTYVLLVRGREVDRIVGMTSYEQLAGMFTKAGAGGGTAAAARADAMVRGQSPDASAARQTAEPSTAPNTFAGDEVREPPAMPTNSFAQTSAPAGGIDNRSTTPPPAAASADGGASGGSNPSRIADARSFDARSSAGASAAGRSPANDRLATDLIDSTVRIHVQENGGFGTGTGTIVDTHDGEALVLTCGHLFRDSNGKGAISVDVFGSRPASNLPGKLLRYDLKSDIALVSIESSVPLVARRVAGKSFVAAKGQRGYTVGCDNGQPPTTRATQITSTRKFLGPDHYMTSGEPAQGRSGGGLFNEAGELIGICSAADPEDHEGMYVALSIVHTTLDQANLAFVYGGDANRANTSTDLAKGPANDFGGNVNGRDNSAILPASAGNSANNISSAVGRSEADGAEVVCVVRNLADPHATRDVVVLDRVSPAFLAQLEQERRTQGARQQTSLPAKKTPAAKATTGKANNWSPNWRTAQP